MCEWISFEERMPKNEKFVLGCDWFMGEPRILVCEGEATPQYYKGKRCITDTLMVYKSICPPIGQGISPFWMSISPENDLRWVKTGFDKVTKEIELDMIDAARCISTLPDPQEFVVKTYQNNYFVVTSFINKINVTFAINKSINVKKIKLWIKIHAFPIFEEPLPFLREMDLSLFKDDEKESI